MCKVAIFNMSLNNTFCCLDLTYISILIWNRQCHNSLFITYIFNIIKWIFHSNFFFSWDLVCVVFFNYHIIAITHTLIFNISTKVVICVVFFFYNYTVKMYFKRDIINNCYFQSCISSSENTSIWSCTGDI